MPCQHRKRRVWVDDVRRHRSNQVSFMEELEPQFPLLGQRQPDVGFITNRMMTKGREQYVEHGRAYPEVVIEATADRSLNEWYQQSRVWLIHRSPR